MQDLNNFVVRWIDWNLCLDPEGGPNWADNFVDSPILVYGDKDQFIKQPMFYAMGHFSKFIYRGSRRIQVSRRSLAPIENVGLLTPNEENLLLVLQNRDEPNPETYMAYTSTNDGLRFSKSQGQVTHDEQFDASVAEKHESLPKEFDFFTTGVVLRVDSTIKFQTIEGFGGAVTDAASLNWRKLPPAAQDKLIETYFGPNGLEYNMMRVPIGGSDFSTHPYTYNEQPWNDTELSNFSLTNEDISFKIPMIQNCIKAATSEIHITATTWSPPVWMKTNEKISGYGQLKTEYYQIYADYHLRFLEEYKKHDIHIWAITTTNEPVNGIIPVVTFNSMGWIPSQLGRWIENNLGPTIRKSVFNRTLILGVDDQRLMLSAYMLGMEKAAPNSINYLDGIAVHYYEDFVSPEILTNLHKRYPTKIIVATEACEGAYPWETSKVKIGSWDRAQNYVKDIIEDLNNYVVGWIDWNLCLDPNGGPNWASNFVDSPIIVYEDKGEFVKQPMYYALGHFSKFIPRGSARLQVTTLSTEGIENVAVITPKGNVVVVMQNRKPHTVPVKIYVSSRKAININMEPESIKTVEINSVS
uniref:Glucosylceramidase n=2 Tax=Bombyx mori TaxID=7091 RepID=A0A8R2C6N0_BOMMO|nr:lysosomal acid glucosylceramidase [Bombyx mori]